MKRFRLRRRCFHHDHSTGQSWVTGTIIDWRKLWTCHQCEKMWVI